MPGVHWARGFSPRTFLLPPPCVLMPNRRFALYAWGVLGYNLLVILWGAFVRATGSGAGCGSHWPTCNGEVIPRAPELETLIELTHRLTSAFAGVLVIILLVWAFFAYQKGHHVRKRAAWSFFFILTEGAIGAGLVVLELVADNDSVARVYWIALHLINTFILVAALTLTAWGASGGGRLDLKRDRRLTRLLGSGLVLMLVLCAAGAVTALGDTLFPPETLAEGITEDFSPTAHFLVRLRIWHPVLAILTGVYLFIATMVVAAMRPTLPVQRFARIVQITFGLQFLGGLVNILLLAPVWMQLVHLLMADLLWIAFVIMGAAALDATAHLPAESASDVAPAEPALATA